MWILGLESSCDDCSAAVVEETSAGPVLRSMTKQSQDHLHGPYGGVVPELAAREHLIQIRNVIGEALAKADLPLSKLDRIAVTQGPGLVGSLLTLFSASKALAWRSWGSLRGLNNSLSQSGSLGIAVASSMSEPAS